MSEQKPGTAVTARKVVVRTDPEASVRIFIEGLKQDLASSETVDPTLENMLQRVPQKVMDLSNKLVMPFGNSIASILTPPQAMDKQIKSRVIEVIEACEVMLNNAITEAEDTIEQATSGEGSEEVKNVVGDKVMQVVETTLVSLLAVLEASNRVLNIAGVNAPAEFSSRLANVLIGYDVLKGEK